MRPWEFTFDSGVIRMFPQPLPMEGQQIASELCEQPELEKEIERLEERIEESESELDGCEERCSELEERIREVVSRLQEIDESEPAAFLREIADCAKYLEKIL